MRISDIEYTRTLGLGASVAATSAQANIDFAVGIAIRPLLMRTHVSSDNASAVTTSMGVFLENGDAIALGQTTAQLRGDPRAFSLFLYDNALVAGGSFTVSPNVQELNWRKLLLPSIRIHIVSSVLVPFNAKVTLMYRFAELTDAEIIDLAAQRAQE